MSGESKTVLKAISDYFNQGDGKRPLSDFSKEIKALSPEEKAELAQGACDVMGWTLIKK
jgi:hypothetical protein